MKLQVSSEENEEQQELTLFKAAITLAEAGMGTFDQCVDALKTCNMDENAALVMLVEKKSAEEELYE